MYNDYNDDVPWFPRFDEYDAFFGEDEKNSDSNGETESFPRVKYLWSLITSYKLPMPWWKTSKHDNEEMAIQLAEYPCVGHQNKDSEHERKPDLAHRNGFQVDSAISHYALGQLGLFSKKNDYIPTSAVKSVYRQALLSSHPDKTHQNTNSEFIRVQNAYDLLMKEEYNPDELGSQRACRRTEVLVNTVLPAVQEQQLANKEMLQKTHEELRVIEKILSAELLAEGSMTQEMEDNQTISYSSLS